MVDVEQWAELRREHFVRRVGIKELARRTGLARNTVRAALRSAEPPGYDRSPVGSKLDPFKDEIHRLLSDDGELTGQRIRELIAPLGFCGGKTIVDDYLREVRPFYLSQRTYQRTIYRPGEICQFDLWEPKEEVAVGHGQTREAWVVVACMGYSRAAAGALIFSKQVPDLLFGIRRCLWSLGAIPETLVWDRQSGLHAAGGRPTVDFAAFCGQRRTPRRGAHLRQRGHRGRARHGRARRPPSALVRAPPHDHRARARPRAEGPARGAPRRPAGPRRRAALARPL
ncbi:MAG: hypothetical protein LC790_23375 [Actinobacteria bacterium]|nr:hypothetical protein [Actinomycetota bacterium]